MASESIDNTKNDCYFIGKITEDLLFIAKHMRAVTIDELGNNEILLDSMMFRLIQISENAKKLVVSHYTVMQNPAS